MEIVTAKCKCGWTGQIYKGKIKAIYCPKCNEKLWIEQEKDEKLEKGEKLGRKRSATTRQFSKK